MMTLRAELERNGGWLHRGDLLDAGWSAAAILTERRRAGIELIRRKWLVLPALTAEIRLAAELGGVVSCVSALRHHGLWVPAAVTEHHLALPPHTASTSTAARCHRTRPLVARSPRTLFDDVVNVLANVAQCLPAVDAFAVWESAAARSLVTPEQLRRIPWLSAAAKHLAERVTDRSDSGVESTFAWKCRRAGIRAVPQVRLARHRVDFLIGRRLVVQLDGWAFHNDASQRRSDIRHDRELAAMGYTVLRFDYVDIMHSWPRVEAELRRAISAGLAS